MSARPPGPENRPNGGDTNKQPIDPLVCLADSCRNHRAHHLSSEQTPGECAETEQDVPDFCRLSLESLRKSLPKVEKKVAAKAQSDPTSIHHLCAFYNQVIGGEFCQHSPHLFKLGKDASEVFPRIHYLLYHSVSPAVLEGTIQQANDKKVLNVLDSICDSGSSFLSFLSDVPLVMEILRDWIQLLLDLSVLSESNCTLSESDPIEVLLFDGALAHTSLPHSTEYPITLCSHQSVLLFQGTCLTIMKDWLFKMADDGGLNDAVGRHLLFVLFQRDPSAIRDMFTFLRQVLLASVPETNEERFLLVKARMAALSIWKILAVDFRRDRYSLDKLPLSLLLVQAVRSHVQTRTVFYRIPLEQSYCRRLASCLLDLLFRPDHDKEEMRMCCSLLIGSIHLIDLTILSSASSKKIMLEMAILNSCHILLCQFLSEDSDWDYLLQQKTVWHLVQLAQLSETCDIAAFVLSALIRSRYPVSELDKICTVVLKESLSQGEETSAGRKRKSPRANNSPRKRTRDSIPEQIIVTSVQPSRQSSTFYATTETISSELLSLLQSAVRSCQSKDHLLALLQDDMNRCLERILFCLGLLLPFMHSKKALTNLPSLPGLTSVISRLTMHLADVISLLDLNQRGNDYRYCLAICCGLHVAALGQEQIEALFIDKISAPTRLLSQVRKSLLSGAVDSETPGLPTLCLGSLFHGHVVSSSERQKLLRCSLVTTKLFCYGDVCISLVASATEGITFGVRWIGPYLSRLDLTDQAQSVRLSLLDDSDTSKDSLLQRTCTYLNSASFSRLSKNELLLCWQCTAWLLSSAPASQVDKFLAAGVSVVQILLESCFFDDTIVQDYLSRELHSALTPNAWTYIEAYVSHGERKPALDSSLALAKMGQELGESAVDAARYLQTVEKQLNKRGGTERSLQRTAIRVLLSQVSGRAGSKFEGKAAELALWRVVMCYSARTKGIPKRLARSCFAEIGRRASIEVDSRIFDICSSTTKAKILSSFLDIDRKLDPASLSAAADVARDKGRFSLLSTFIRTFLLDGTQPESLAINMFEYVEDQLPRLLSKAVIEMNINSLRTIVVFKAFVGAQIRFCNKQQSRIPSTNSTSGQAPDIAVGSQTSFLLSSSLSRLFSTYEKTENEQLIHLCFSREVLPRVLPLILSRARKNQLVFFSNIWGNQPTLQAIIQSHHQKLIQNLVWQLGESHHLTATSVRAIILASLIREHGLDELQSPLLDQVSHDMRPFELQAEIQRNPSVSQWVNADFMFLLVNMVQFKWGQRSLDEMIQALHSLIFMLSQLASSDASQYYPQLMATYNAAVSSSSCTSERGAYVKYLAVRVLSKYVTLLAEEQLEFLGGNLGAIVVSLIPVVLDGSFSGGASSAKDAGLSLLAWLVEGELGQKLADYFQKIPFIPSSEEFDPMRESLKKLGVDYDTFISTHGTQERSSRSSYASEDTSSGAKSSTKQNALRNRIETVRGLLGDENASIRRVAIEYLTELLRGNRSIFEALVANERDTSMKHYITVAYEGTLGASRGVVRDLVDTLLRRSVEEGDPGIRGILGKCIGEVGAIGSQHLEGRAAEADVNLLPQHGPWRCQPAQYELKLVTDDLVTSLKAAETSADQHKIAFTIQQLLALLDKSAVPEAVKERPGDNPKGEMKEWLATKLKEADVYEVVEPFWWTEFCMTDQSIASAKSPPYFEKSRSYYNWISDWTRFMVLRAHDTSRGPWAELFYSCRSALRTPVGLGVAELLLPILVLDRICFGDGQDEQTVVEEMRMALTFDGTTPQLSRSERQKAAKAVLDVIDIFQYWCETETESKYSTSRSRSTASGASRATAVLSEHWSLDESLMRIDDVLQAIPLSLRASAAGHVGMHARALRYYEMLARSEAADEVFNAVSATNSSGSLVSDKRTRSRAAGVVVGSTASQLLQSLASLSEYETMECLEEDENIGNAEVRISGSIKRNEAASDWESALQDYERALKLGDSAGDPSSLRTGSLNCLLQLGHFDSVLSQVKGFLHDSEVFSDEMASIATQASWRLGNWEMLEDIVCDDSSATRRDVPAYEMALGKTMLCLHQRDKDGVTTGLLEARMSLVDMLSLSPSTQHESLVRLQGLREVEDVLDSLCNEQPANLGDRIVADDLCWEQRLDLVDPADAHTIINIRLALARLAVDRAFEGSLFLNIGRRERKRGFHGLAASALAQAEAAFETMESTCYDGEMLSSLKLQFAKLKYDCGNSSSALRMLQTEDIDEFSNFDRSTIISEAKKRTVRLLGSNNLTMTEAQQIRVFAKNTLQSTQWMIEGGLKGGSEIINRFRILQKIEPKWEKGHFHFAKYIDSVLKARTVAVLNNTANNPSVAASDEVMQEAALIQDTTCQRYVVLAMNHYAQTIALSNKHVYQALPRLLSLWFEFTGVGRKSRESKDTAALEALREKQDEANVLMAKHFKEIPASSFYTAMPQVMSRIAHEDNDTSTIVKSILRRVLAKYPGQAMWHLGWLLHSRQSERREYGHELFADAERSLMKGPNPRLRALLSASKSLFVFLQRLAAYHVKDRECGEVSIKAWEGEVSLSEFIPPVQAALSASISCGDSSRVRDLFPRHVPRMRSFCGKVKILASKARPKKLKAFVVSSESARRLRGKSMSASSHDIGEIHFLVKQEKKGDLRKDARVQDLNNVINRLVTNAASDRAGGSPRRLALRTFAVTCLSEDTGILEWVPNTAALRSLVSKVYNPQASPHSARRRGGRLTNFGPSLRNNYEKKCQPMYFQNGDLKNAARLFEELCLKPNPPLFYWWFVQSFPDPHSWYEARLRFVLSSAAWSAVGHVIGLGDRHSENILIDTESGECVHVDFDCIFDKGLYLPKPEVVPFRLTQNMVDAFGPTGADGVFSASLICAMRTLRQNRDTLLSVLEPFLKDPIIDWRRYRSQQEPASSTKQRGSNEDRQAREAKRSISVIDERLRGIYNLRNPNLRRIRRSDAVTAHEDSDLAHMLPLSVEGQVHRMIAEATSSENLCQMYVGWMSWI